MVSVASTGGLLSLRQVFPTPSHTPRCRYTSCPQTHGYRKSHFPAPNISLPPPGFEPGTPETLVWASSYQLPSTTPGGSLISVCDGGQLKPYSLRYDAIYLYTPFDNLATNLLLLLLCLSRTGRSFARRRRRRLTGMIKKAYLFVNFFSIPWGAADE
jgi:hypothetical protein